MLFESNVQTRRWAVLNGLGILENTLRSFVCSQASTFRLVHKVDDRNIGLKARLHLSYLYDWYCLFFMVLPIFRLQLGTICSTRTRYSRDFFSDNLLDFLIVVLR